MKSRDAVRVFPFSRFRPTDRCATTLIFKQKQSYGIYNRQNRTNTDTVIPKSTDCQVELTGARLVRRKRKGRSQTPKKDIINTAKNEFIRDRKRPFREPSDAGSDEFNEMKKIHSDTGTI